jgi:hypothetical protein
MQLRAQRRQSVLRPALISPSCEKKDKKNCRSTSFSFGRREVHASQVLPKSRGEGGDRPLPCFYGLERLPA